MAKKKSDTNIVAQCNHLLDARKILTLREYKLFLFLVSQIDTLGDSEIEPIKVSINDFAYFLGIEKNKNMFDELRKTTKSLKSRVVELWDEKRETLIQIGFLDMVRYEKKEGNVYILISNYMYPYLFELKKNFTQFRFENIINLSSLYALRVYELMKKNEYKNNVDFELEDLRKKLGIKENELTNFADFNKRVLYISEREINNKTDIKISYEPIKTGRKVTQIKFKAFKLPKSKTKRADIVKLSNAGVNEIVDKVTKGKKNTNEKKEPQSECEFKQETSAIVEISKKKRILSFFFKGLVRLLKTK